MIGYVRTLVHWGSSSSGVATVDAAGLASAWQEGTTTISASLIAVSTQTTLGVTPAPPPADEGPGGPILVVSSAANPFGRYLVEILLAEGLNAYRAQDISTVTAGTLSGYDVVILGELALTAGQVGMFTDWVNAGGN
ncbi:MAG TPA: hypothetical protein VLH36_14315, partial [Steroidobacteraceae bacterium]|nr:hypothetical protein [Steroidobacteraceae bacterium]